MDQQTGPFCASESPVNTTCNLGLGISYAELSDPLNTQSAELFCVGRVNQNPVFGLHTGLNYLNPMQTIFRKFVRPVNPSIVLLLLVGYVLMGCMMAEQNRTISAQRDLIRKLFRDNVSLSVAKVNANQPVHQR